MPVPIELVDSLDVVSSLVESVASLSSTEPDAR